MTGRFTSSPIDQRRLSQPRHRIARQSYGERQRIHGAIQPMEGPAPDKRKVALLLALFLITGAIFLGSLPS